MDIKTLQAKLDLEAIQLDWQDKEITSGYTSDLLSDVMANALDGSVLITIQAHVNTIAVAVLAGIPAIILCNDRPVPDDMLEAAKSEKVAIFRTKQNQFLTSCDVNKALNSAPCK